MARDQNDDQNDDTDDRANMALALGDASFAGGARAVRPSPRRDGPRRPARSRVVAVALL